MALKLLEHYTSIQGEGSRTGILTQFVRFAGCNLRCPSWPCDTPQAIYPDQYMGQYENLAPETLTLKIIDQMREKKARNICVTGGEPFMQNSHDMDTLIMQLLAYQFTVEVFTNGTMRIPGPWLAGALINMDWKLAGSGEGQKAPEQKYQNVRMLKPDDMIKFVVKDQTDLDEALSMMSLLREATLADFWVGAAWGEITTARLVEWVQTVPFDVKINTQIHKFIWPAEARYV